ncbi:hypothetical protein [Photobacterium lutimaris]|nr:hypothetical protein [Photobacterium lutimaris]TDR74875.1 hypothetical protein DFP78_106206 [Photobacterium lutimaris]
MKNCNVHEAYFHKIPVCFVALMMATSFSVSAESFLMGFDEYMERCMTSYGTDQVTRSVCENQYKAIEQKEQEMFAKANGVNNKAWSKEKNNSEVLIEKN